MCFLSQMGGQPQQPAARPAMNSWFQPNFLGALYPRPTNPMSRGLAQPINPMAATMGGIPGTPNYGAGPEHAFFPNTSVSNPGGGPLPAAPAPPVAPGAAQPKKDTRLVYDATMQAWRPAYAVNRGGDHGGSGNKGGNARGGVGRGGMGVSGDRSGNPGSRGGGSTAGGSGY